MHNTKPPVGRRGCFENPQIFINERGRRIPGYWIQSLGIFFITRCLLCGCLWLYKEGSGEGGEPCRLTWEKEMTSRSMILFTIKIKRTADRMHTTSMMNFPSMPAGLLPLAFPGSLAPGFPRTGHHYILSYPTPLCKCHCQLPSIPDKGEGGAIALSIFSREAVSLLGA